MKTGDLTGQRFGLLSVLGDSGQRGSAGVILWRCRCDCGTECLATRRQLESGNAVSCGCVLKPGASKRQAEDLTGRRFGSLTVLHRVENDKANRVCWACRCDCGNEITVQALRLKSGHTGSCGCKRRRPSLYRNDLTGQRFGRLTVLYPLERQLYPRKTTWHCRCDCGNEVDVISGSLVRGLTKSCGCWNSEQRAKMHDHMHYQDDTCVERLKRIDKDTRENKAGFRGLFLTKSGRYRVAVTFQKVHYTIGYYETFEEAVRVRLEAEEDLHQGYLNALKQYEQRAQADPAWAQENPFYYEVRRANGRFSVRTNGELPFCAD